MQFGYCGFSFLCHAVSLSFMVFCKLRWLYNSFPTGLKESLKRVIISLSCYQ